MSTTTFSLEHFYYSQPNPSAPSGSGTKPVTARVIAISEGVTREIAAAAIERVSLPAMPQHYGTWGLVRGNRQLPFVMVQAQPAGDERIISHYILIPMDVLRSMGGNLHALMTLLEDDVLVHAGEGTRLPLLQLQQPDLESDDEQVDHILHLMDITNNHFDVIEMLLAALVRGKQIIIQNAPIELQERVDFIAGVLALLPVSVRYAVTFSTYNTEQQTTDAQIRFYNDQTSMGTPSRDGLIYDWTSARVTSQTIEDDYSHFIMSQLRLDTSLVIERTKALTQTTGWRMKQGDKLGEALAYGSHRLKLDTSLLNNLPVNKEDVAKVLAEDPTLSEELRVMYGQHLLTFSLAMDDIQHAEPIIQWLSESPELEKTTYRKIEDALNNKQAGTVYKLVSRWLTDAKLAQPDQWVDLAHRAAITQIEILATNKSIDLLNSFSDTLLQSSPALHLNEIIGRLLEKVLPLTPQDARLAENTFLLAAAHMDTPVFKRLLDVKSFTGKLRPQVTQVLNFLSGGNTLQPPKDLLMNAARSFTQQYEPIVLLRFAELARQIGRFDLLDEAVLRYIANFATSPQAQEHNGRLWYISERLNDGDLNLLGAKTAQHLLRIRLAIGDYVGLAEQMIQQSTTFYRGDLQTDYIKVVEQVFATTPTSPHQTVEALTGIQLHGIKSAPLLMASIGALQNRPRSPELEGIADHVANLLATDPRLMNVIPAESILRLLTFNIKGGDQASALHLTHLVSGAIAAYGEDALEMTTQMYKALAANRSTRNEALEILRVYVREIPDNEARIAVGYYGRELGANVRQALDAVYILKQVMANKDLPTYAQAIQRVVGFLQDSATSYADPRTIPTLEDLITKLNGMRDTFTREERRIFTKAMLTFIKGLVALYQQQKAQRTQDIDRLLNGTADPLTVLDLIRVMAGYFTDGKRVNLTLRAAIPDPLGTRTRKFLRDEVMAGSELIISVQRLSAPEEKLEVKASALREALESLKQTIDLSEPAQRTALQNLGADLQRLAILIEVIVDKTDPRVIDEDGGLGSKIDTLKVRPRNALEYLRLIHGYHLTRG